MKLFFEGAPLPLPTWFRKGGNCKLNRKSILENFPNYINSEASSYSNIFKELNEYKFKRKQVYSAYIIRFSLLTRYTSLKMYKMLQEEFPLPSVSLLRKIVRGDIDAFKSAKLLTNRGRKTF